MGGGGGWVPWAPPVGLGPGGTRPRGRRRKDAGPQESTGLGRFVIASVHVRTYTPLMTTTQTTATEPTTRDYIVIDTRTGDDAGTYEATSAEAACAAAYDEVGSDPVGPELSDLEARVDTDTRDATVYERGNGLPDVGDYVSDDEGNLWQIAGALGRIETSGCQGNHCDCQVIPADWDDLGDEEPFPAVALVAAG